MFNKTIQLLLTVLIISNISFAQISVSGIIKNADDGNLMGKVNVFIAELNKEAVSNQSGFFEFKNIDTGSYHLIISHAHCVPEKLYIEINKDTLLNLSLHNEVTLLSSVTINAAKQIKHTHSINKIKQHYLKAHANEQLSTILENITGVRSLKNGGNMSKPVVNGLYGSRLTILNNGIPQSGQQWGNDHTPEIDPLIANQLTVIKGTSALEHQGSNLGNIIIINPEKISKDPHIHGNFNYFFETNGRGHGLNAQLEKHTQAIDWRVNATLKKSGDKHTPDYYLKNTGAQEQNFSLQLEKKINKKLHTDLYISSFNTELGILKGSHISNVTDLQEAMNRDEPFYTSDSFSYRIEAPRQKVGHHLLKLHSSYFIDNSQWLDFTLATQYNNRKEYDVRRGGRTSRPTLSLQQLSNYFESKYRKTFNNRLQINSGLQYTFIDNSNNIETGTFPLIPDYRSHALGIYTIATLPHKKHFFELGARYDFVNQDAYVFKKGANQKVNNYINNYNNLSLSSGWNYSFSSRFRTNVSIGIANRNPAINELYSYGLHQGVSSFEEGDINLKSEYSYKTTLNLTATLNNEITFDSYCYYQHINNYIFVNPQDKFILTIRGAFPYFKYEQANARIYGWDFSAKFKASPRVNTRLDFSYLKGDNLSKGTPLVYMPANNAKAIITYTIPHIDLLPKIHLDNLSLGVVNEYVFKQEHLFDNQDYSPAPDAYYLLGVNASMNVQIMKKRLVLNARINNLLNERYRDYLNRQRYFADEIGRNFIIGLNLSF